MAAKGQLPDFVAPMLATAGVPFDDPGFLFEVKWDGTRAVAFVDGGGRYRLLNRRCNVLTDRYPELEVLSKLPAGTVLDGEIVVLKDGKPDFPSLLSREQARTPRKPEGLRRSLPATYVVFDQLYHGFEPLLDQTCEARRERLRQTVAPIAGASVAVSEGVVGAGQAYFEQVRLRGLEGVVAKKLASRYLPGRRSPAWLKIKQTLSIRCAVIGFVPKGVGDFKNLILAAEDDAGGLTCVGTVGSGIDDALRLRISTWLASNLRDSPLVATDERGRWVGPGLYCTVNYFERTAGGRLRAPVLGEVYGA